MRPGGRTNTRRHAEAFTPLLRQAAAELTEYFAGRRRAFTLPLRPKAPRSSGAVWDALRTIPYGESRSYKQIAAQIGRPTACRAVGMANHRNPIAIGRSLPPRSRQRQHFGQLCGRAGDQGLPARARTGKQGLKNRRPANGKMAGHLPDFGMHIPKSTAEYRTNKGGGGHLL